MEVIISAFVGLVAGTIGSLVAPWVQWGLEKRKNLRTKRENLINSLRSYVSENDPKDLTFLNSINYIQIRPFLSQEFIAELEDQHKVVVKSSFRGYYQEKFFAEIDNIEKKWNLYLGKSENGNDEYKTKSEFKVIVNTRPTGK